MRKDARHHRSLNAGWPEAAMAGALGIRLCGPRSYEGEIADEPWLNAAAPDPAKDLLDEDRLGRLTRLQKGSRRIGDGNPRQHHPNRPALDNEDFATVRAPDDAGKVEVLGKPGQRFESAESWPFGSFDQQIDAAVGAGQGQLRCPARRHQVTPEAPQLVDETEKRRLEHRALSQIDEVVAKPLTEADLRPNLRIVGPHQTQPRTPPRRCDRT